MKKQIVIIHGGHAEDENEDFLERLREKKVTAEDFKKSEGGWKDNLEIELENNFEFFYPRMPNGEWANYEHWKIWFERMIPFLSDNIIFIGHSLGGLFLVKYFSENIFPLKVRALILVATPYEGRNEKHLRNDNFIFSGESKNISQQVPEIYLFHSKDDAVVPYSDFEKYKIFLPSAHFLDFESEGHFNGKEVPNLTEILKSLSKN